MCSSLSLSFLTSTCEIYFYMWNILHTPCLFCILKIPLYLLDLKKYMEGCISQIFKQNIYSVEYCYFYLQQLE